MDKTFELGAGGGDWRLLFDVYIYGQCLSGTVTNCAAATCVRCRGLGIGMTKLESFDVSDLVLVRTFGSAN